MLIANVSPRTGGKTTDSGWIAHALIEDERAYDVVGYDADHSKQFWSWSQEGQFPFPVKQAASARFHTDVVVPEGQIAIVDCGHSENHPYITDSVLRVADLVILHMAPTGGDYERIVKPIDATPFGDIIKRSAALRADRMAPPTWVLLNRCVTNASSIQYYREEMQAEGFDVFSTTIRRSETFAQSIGYPVVGAKKTEFGALVTEMKTRGLLRE